VLAAPRSGRSDNNFGICTFLYTKKNPPRKIGGFFVAETEIIWYLELMTRRVQRVAKLLKQQLAIMVRVTLPEEVGIVTVTDVEVSSDIKNATVFISCFDKTYEKEVKKHLEENSKEFQRILGKNFQMRYTPKLNFKIDQGLEKINRVEELLKEIKKT